MLTRCRSELLKENDPASSLVFSFSYGCSLTDPARSDDRRHVRVGIERMADGEVHNHRIQYRVKDVTGRYVLCESRGYRLEGTDGMPTVYVGYIINRSAAEVTDLATGLGNFRGLMSALGETRTKGCSRNRMPARLQAQPA